MFRILSVVALSVGMATSAMAHGGDAGGAGGGPNGSGTHAGSWLSGETTNGVMSPDTMTTGSIAGTAAQRAKLQNCKASAYRTVSGTIATNPSAGTNMAGSATCH